MVMVVRKMYFTTCNRYDKIIVHEKIENMLQICFRYVLH